MVKQTFSKRQGYRNTFAEITLREDAPEELRSAIPTIARHQNMSPETLRNIVSRVLLVDVNESHVSKQSIYLEVKEQLNECKWFEVYDIAEEIYSQLSQSSSKSAKEYSDRLNHFFYEHGIGWEMKNGEIRFRSADKFIEVLYAAATTTQKSNRPRAESEIREAISDILRRPNPDLSGAIHHAMAALEAIARDTTGKRSSTLGNLIPQLDLPKPFDEALKQLWNFASEGARHAKEGTKLNFSETKLLVSVTCATCTYLIERESRKKE